MADVVRFELKGAQEIIRRMREFTPKLRRSGARKAARRAMRIVQKAAQANAKALDDPASTERIWKNIAIQESRRGSKRVGGVLMKVGVRGGARSRSENATNPGGDTFYWRFVEFGTQKARARPFMLPALANNVGAVTDEFVRTLNAEIDKVTASASASL